MEYNNKSIRPQVLLYHFALDERTEMIERYLAASGVEVRHVRSDELSEKLGWLVGLSGYEKNTVRSFGLPFSEEMLVMAGFDQDRLNAFLRFFKERNIRRVELKAVLTPSNAAWDAASLYRHMSQERDALRKLNFPERVKNT